MFQVTMRLENISSRIDVQTQSGRALDNPVTSRSVHAEHPSGTTCLPTFVLVATAAFLLERGRALRRN